MAGAFAVSAQPARADPDVAQYRLQQWLHERVALRLLPGAVAAVRLPDGRVIASAAGYADVEGAERMTTFHRMLGASMGKTFVSALCLVLKRQGVLRLDDPISTWLSEESWFARLPNGNAITLRMLLNHSSGLCDFVDEPGYGPLRASALRTDRIVSTDEKMSFVIDKAPLFSPGMGFKYSDTDYVLVGTCIERAVHKSYYDQIRDVFLWPLALKMTSPSNQRTLTGLAVGYSEEGGRYASFGYPRRLVEDGRLVYNPATEWTGGGLVTNPQDLVRWIDALMTGVAIDRRDVPELLRGAIPNSLPGGYYGQGARIYRGPAGEMIGHNGGMAGYSGFVYHLPSRRVSFSIQTNTTSLDDTMGTAADFAVLAASLT